MKLAEYLTNLFLNEGLITENDKEIIIFGLKNLESNLFGIFVTVVIGICFRHICEALFLWLFLFPLRKNAGGYHASTQIRCMIISTIIIVISFFLYVVFLHVECFYCISIIISSVIVYKEAPMENPVKLLDKTELITYRRRSRIVLIMEVSIFVLSLYFRLCMVCAGVTLALFVVSVSLMMGKYAFRRSKLG